MKKPRISVVVAVSKSGAIGKGNDLLFHISDDLKRFKALTKGHPVIMGRKTFESIGRVLPERRNIIVTRDRSYRVPGGEVAYSLEEALALAELRGLDAEGRGSREEEIFIIGGGEIYKQGLPYTDKLYLTLVESDAKGDVFFPNWASPSYSERLGRSKTGTSPDWRTDFTKETFREERVDPKTGLKYTWVDLERKK